ncbi:sulfotransferase family protein [Lysobacter xanthus]
MSISFDRPVIILSPPRSGSTLFFETLAQAPGLYTIGSESHGVIERIQGLHPSHRGYDSNRLDVADATPAVVDAVRAGFAAGLRDRDGRGAPDGAVVRFLEKTPKNSLRIPFLDRVFPDARYVVLYRDPREVLASMIEAWRSGRYRMYPFLPGWTGPTWSLLLVPGWRELIGRPLEHVVAAQWAVTMNALIDDLSAFPDDRVVRVRHDAFLADPNATAARVAHAVDLRWDRDLAALPFSRHTLTPPRPGKWRAHEEAIRRVWPLVEPTARRACDFFGAPPPEAP